MASSEPNSPQPCGSRLSPPETEGEGRCPGPEEGAPWSPHAWDEPGGPRGLPSMEDNGSCGASHLGGRRRPWLPPEEEDGWRVLHGDLQGPPWGYWSPEQGCRRSSREPPGKRARSLPTGEWWRDSLSPPGGTSWISDDPQVQCSDPVGRLMPALSGSETGGDGDCPGDPSDRLDSPQRESRQRLAQDASAPEKHARGTWFPRAEVVDYWKGCQSIMRRDVRAGFLSACPEPCIPDGTAKPPATNQAVFKLLTETHTRIIYHTTHYTFATQKGVLDMLAPAMAIYDMAAGAIEKKEGVDPLAVRRLARHLLSYAGSANQRLKLQRCSAVLEAVNPQLATFTTRMTGQNSDCLLFPEDKVSILKAVIHSFSMLPEEPPEMDFGPCRDVAGTPFGASPLECAIPFHEGPIPMYEHCSDQPFPMQDETCLDLWHRRFGHVDPSSILRLQNSHLATGIKINATKAERTATCITCLVVKGDHLLSSLTAVRSSTALRDLIHCELSEPFNVPSLTLRRYVLIFVDDFSRFCVAYLLQDTGEMHGCFERYLAMLSKNNKPNPKMFNLNSAADSVSPQTLAFLERQGIAHKRGFKPILGESGTAEREMGCLLEMTRCMLADAMLPDHFWGHAIMTATYLWNRLPIGRKRSTPSRLWHGKVLSVKHLRVFGSLVRDRLEPRDGTQCIFVGYGPCKMGYQFMNLETGVVLEHLTLDFDERKMVEKRGHILDCIERDGYDMPPGDRDGYVEAHEPIGASMPCWAPASAIGRASQFARSFPEDNVSILKAGVRRFPMLPEEPPEMNFGSCRDVTRPPFIALEFAPPFQDGVYEHCPDYQPQLQDETSLDLWHRRFGHADSTAILRLQNGPLATGIEINTAEAERIARCVTCLAVKGDQPLLPLSAVKRSTALMDLIHCELYGPVKVPSLTHRRYVLVFVDEFSRFCVTYLLEEMSETHECFEKYLAVVRKKRKSNPKAFQMNSAADAISPCTQGFLERRGIAYQRGGTAEQEMGCLLEMTRCMLADAMLPGQFWGHAIMTATYLWNRLATKHKKRTPFQAWHGKVPSVKHLRVFGSLVHDQSEPHRRAQCIFVGYDSCKLGYRFMNLETGVVLAKHTLDFSEWKGVEKRGSVLDTLERQGYDMSAQLELCRTLGTYEARNEACTPGDGCESMDLEADEPIEASMPHWAPASATGHSSPSARPLTEDNVSVLKAAIRSFPVSAEEPPEMNFGNCQEVARPPFIASPLEFAPPFQDGPAPMYDRCSDQQPQLPDEACLDLWHRRFGHANTTAILWLQNGNLATGMRINPTEAERIAKCVTCLAVKGDHPLSSLNAAKSSTTALMDLIHCELYGPFDVPSFTLHRYVLIFVEDFSRFCVAYLLQETGETHRSVEKYLALLSKTHGRQPKVFQMNSAADSISPQTLAFLEAHGIAHKRGVKPIFGENGTAEWEMGCLLEMTRCMLADAMLPDHFWGHAITTATYLWNRLANKLTKRTPFQIWHGKVPSLNHLRVFGSLVRHRGEPPSPAQQVFVGYSTFGYGTSETGYQFMNLETGLVHAKRTLDFDERKGVEKRGRVLHTVERQGYDMSPQLELRRMPAGGETQDEGNAPGDGYESMDLESDDSTDASIPHCALAPVVGHSSQLETAFLEDNRSTWQDFEEIPINEAQRFPPPPFPLPPPPPPFPPPPPWHLDTTW